MRIEAGFASDSTLLMISVPVSMMAYLPPNPAITLLGTTRSANLMRTPSARSETQTQASSVATKNKGLESYSRESEGSKETRSKGIPQQALIPAIPIQTSLLSKPKSWYPTPLSSRTNSAAPIKTSGSTASKGQTGSLPYSKSAPY